MVDLILRPSTIDPKNSFALQLRFHESLGETEYYTLCRISMVIADDIVRAGAPYFMFNEPEDEGVDLKAEMAALRTRCEKAEAELADMTKDYLRRHNDSVDNMERALVAESICEELVKALEEAEPVAWRFRYDDGKWNVQKNKPAWYRDFMADVEIEPLFSLSAYRKATDDLKEAEGVVR